MHRGPVGRGDKATAPLRHPAVHRDTRFSASTGRVDGIAGSHANGAAQYAVVRAKQAYGAGILSSPGEIEEFRGMSLKPLDLIAMGTTDYDITVYQDLLYAASSFSQVEDVVGTFWDTCDDDGIAALMAAA